MRTNNLSEIFFKKTSIYYKMKFCQFQNQRSSNQLENNLLKTKGILLNFLCLVSDKLTGDPQIVMTRP